jgi:pantetheine-phosphate adenylyltransferase
VLTKEKAPFKKGPVNINATLLKADLMERIAVYPGSFDPVTNGHLDIVRRGLKLFDRVVVAILVNPKKQFLFPLEERLDMLRVCLQDFKGAEVDAADGLLVDYAARHGATAILRGLRALSDFEYEFQMALMNRRLDREIQTVFLMTGMRWIYTSSSIIKEAAQFGGDVQGMVPPMVLARLKEKFSTLDRSR